jgi:hypothetical protein
MRNIWLVALVSATVGVVGVENADAAPGDVNALLKQNNAICDQQRRGERPRYPDMCLPEIPPGPVYEDRSRPR